MTAEAAESGHAVGPAGRVHRRGVDGRRRDLLAPRRRRRGRRIGRLDLVPARRRRRRAPGLFLLEDRRALPVVGRPARVRRPRLRQRPYHRGHRLAGPRRQRDHHGDGRGVVRQLCGRRGRRGGLGVRNEGLRRAPDRGDVGPELVRLAGGGQGPVRRRGRRHRHPLALRGRDPRERRLHAACPRRTIRRWATSSGASR